jgi:hypothetical protein
MKKSLKDRRRLVLTTDIVRTLDPKDLGHVAGAVQSGERSASLSGCPACGEP